jgi:hypothetical protein
MSRTRYHRTVVGATALAALVPVLTWAFADRMLTVADADRVQPGMARADVERVFGRPPDHETRHPGGNAVTSWDSRRAVIYVFFRAGRVDYTIAYPQEPEPVWNCLARWVDRSRNRLARPRKK